MQDKQSKTESILIIDDEPANLHVLKNILFQKKYQITVAQHGIEAIKIAKIINPDLILLDVKMPEMDGYEICNLLKNTKETMHIPIIFITVKISTNDIIKGFEYGAVDYITKPFNSVELLHRIKTHLDLKRKNDQILISNYNFRTLLQIMSHDLSNSLGFISSLFELAEQDQSVLTEFFKDMKIAIKNSFEIINVVRTIRAIDDGKMDLKLESFNLSDMVTESLKILSPQIKSKEININIDIDKSIFIYVERYTFVNSVLNNILTNSIKFSYNGSQINLSAYQEESIVKIIVEDFGVGMPDESLQRFNVQRKIISRRGTEGEQGTGYGLLLIKRFVEIYGGLLIIESIEAPDESHGTKVVLILKSH